MQETIDIIFSKMAWKLQPHPDIHVVHDWSQLLITSPLHILVFPHKNQISLTFTNWEGDLLWASLHFSICKIGKMLAELWSWFDFFLPETPMPSVASQFQMKQDSYYPQLAKQNSFFPGDEEHISRKAHEESILAKERLCLTLFLMQHSLKTAWLSGWMSVGF